MMTTGPAQSTRLWYALAVECDAAAREAVEYALMEAGALGTETEDGVNGFFQVAGYFDQKPNRERASAEITEALRIYQLSSFSVGEMILSEIPDQDWLGEWKKSWQPVEVGERFIIAPPWAEISDAHDRIVVRIEPGMAFG